MPMPTPGELRAAYAAALEQNGGAIGSAAGLRAAVAVVLPDEAEPDSSAPWSELHRQSERRRIREKFLALADALGPLAFLRQVIFDELADQKQADA